MGSEDVDHDASKQKLLFLYSLTYPLALPFANAD